MPGPAPQAAATGRLPEPIMSRKHATGAGSTRSYMFTLFGEFVMPSGGTVWTSTLVGALVLLGFEERATRQALARAAAAGWLQSERQGRKTSWQITASGERVLKEGRDRIFDFRGVQDNWDGRWLVVLARVPDAARAAGQQLRTRLRWAGLGSPAPGVWVSTHVERLTEAKLVISNADLSSEAQIFIAEHAGGGGNGEARDVVQQAWNLETIQASYQDFLTDFPSSVVDAPPLARLVTLAHAWRRFPMIDPALPRELLPAEWDGTRAADVFRELHGRWHPAALEQWNALPQ